MLELASLDDSAVAACSSGAGADLVLTDSNRRRSQQLFAGVRDNTGPTDAAGTPVGEPGSNDFRLDVFPGSDDASRTVVEQHGGRASANAAFGPADRAARAFDGDLRTAWRVGGDLDGQQLVLRAPKGGVRADHVTLVQPQVLVDERSSRRCGSSSTTARPSPSTSARRRCSPTGQVVPFPSRTVHQLVIEPLATNVPAGDLDPATDAPLPTNPVGFAEVRLDDVRITGDGPAPGRLRPPHRRRRRRATASTSCSPGCATNRVDATATTRSSRSTAASCSPTPVSIQLSGTARIDPNAPDALLDTLLGTTAPGTQYTSSGHL